MKTTVIILVVVLLPVYATSEDQPACPRDAQFVHGRCPGMGCLSFSDLTLRGIVTNAEGQTLAVVIGGSMKRAYFLMQDHNLKDVRVRKITSDSIVFCQYVDDRGQAVEPRQLILTVPATQGRPIDTSETREVKSQQKIGAGCTSGPYTGKKFDFFLAELNLKDFFRLIHQMAGLNLVVDQDVEGTVSLNAGSTPWDQALAQVLKEKGLECELLGNILRIATVESLKNPDNSPAAGDALKPVPECVTDGSDGVPVNLDLKDLALSDFFRLIHEVSRLTVTVDPEVKGTITIDVTDADWKKVLKLAAKSSGFRCKFEGTTLQIAAAK